MVEGLRDLDWRRSTEGYRQPTKEDLEQWRRDGSAAVDDAKADVVQAALRLIAARLVAQPTQENTSDTQLFTAIRRFEEAREARNARWDDEWRRRPRVPEDRAGRRAHVPRTGNPESSQTLNKPVEQTPRALRARDPTKKIGIYDALDEQNRRRRESFKPEST